MEHQAEKREYGEGRRRVAYYNWVSMLENWVSMLELSSNPRRTALAIAMLADALQIVFLPVFTEGALSPLDDLLDIAVAWMLIRLLGWHWAFLPSLVAELVPGLDLVPTWTMAVLVVTRGTPREQTKIEPPMIEGRP
jgi:hypothetical protein